MAITYKVILDTRRENSKSLYPVRLRIYQEGQYRDHTLSFRLSSEQWDAGMERVTISCPEYASYNAVIEQKIAAIKSLITVAEFNKQALLVADVVSVLNKADGRGERTRAPSSESSSSCLFEYAGARIQVMRDEGRIGNAIVYSCAVNKLKGFVGKKRLPFSELTHSLLSRWNTDMIKGGLRTNAISNYLRTIRALYNAAVVDGLADKAAYPFARISIKSEKTPSRSLTLDEMKRIVQTELPEGSPMELYRRLFLLSFLLIGANFADLLTLATENLIDGRVVFHRKKTGKLYSIAIPEQALILLNDFKHMPAKHHPRYILPFIDPAHSPAEHKRQIALVISNAIDNMKKVAKKCGVNKSVTTYYARYAWANIARKDAGCSRDLIAEALGHAYGNKVTGIYMDSYSEEEVDVANAHVSSLVTRPINS